MQTDRASEFVSQKNLSGPYGCVRVKPLKLLSIDHHENFGYSVSYCVGVGAQKSGSTGAPPLRLGSVSNS